MPLPDREMELDFDRSVVAGHKRGQDVIAVPIEVLPGAIVFGGGARVGVPGGDLHVAQWDAGVEHGRDVGVPQGVRVDPVGDPAADGEPFDDSVRGASFHPQSVAVEQDGSGGAAFGGAVQVAGDLGCERDDRGFCRPCR